VAAEEGRPFLVLNTASGTSLRRFDPWLGRFLVPEGDSPRVPVGAQFVSVDAGLFVWLETGGASGLLRAFRHGTRNPFSAAVAPLLLSGTVGTSPDRAPGPAIRLDPSPLGGAILAEAGASLVVTDTTYADVFVTVDVVGDALPIVRLGEQGFGSGECPWPASGSTARLERTGHSVTLRVGEATRVCAGPPGRAAIRVEAPPTAPNGVHLVSFTVRRSAPP
jgi:hypothetical protein